MFNTRLTYDRQCERVRTSRAIADSCFSAATSLRLLRPSSWLGPHGIQRLSTPNNEVGIAGIDFALRLVISSSVMKRYTAAVPNTRLTESDELACHTPWA